MDKLDAFIKSLKEIGETDKQLQKAFYFVRDIPYSTIDSHGIADAIESNRADCYAKSQLLKDIFEQLGYKSRILVMQYRLRDYPDEVKYIPGQLDYHYVPQILLGKDWISVDATYDPPLAKLGFIVNEWDGKTSTPFCEKGFSQKIVGQYDHAFHAELANYNIALEKAYDIYLDEITTYSIKFNEWLMSER